MAPGSKASRAFLSLAFLLATVSAHTFPSSSLNGGWDLGVRSWSPWTPDHLVIAFFYAPTDLPIRFGGGGGWAFERGPMGVVGFELPLWEVWNEENHGRTWGLVTRGSLYVVNNEPPSVAGSMGLSLPLGDGFVPTVFLQVHQHLGWQFLVSLNGAVGFE